MSDPPGESRVAVVIPAADAAAYLDRVLPAALAAEGVEEVVVVDDGSVDGTGEIAAALGARVIGLPERRGPSSARNVGVGQVEADVVLFLDADCVPRRDVVKRVQDAFASAPDLVSVCGSYEPATPDPGFFSQYANLRHHFTHQNARRRASSFWTGCGAVRREAFLAAGGFDEEHFPNGMEDMDLSLRLRKLGETRLDPDLRVTHLKRWTLRTLVAAEIRKRAIPWSRLILERDGPTDDLNLRTSQRMAGGLAPLALVAVAALPAAVAFGAWWTALVALAVVFASVGVNLPMLAFFARERGIPFAAAAWLFHQVHLVYSLATLLYCGLFRPWRRSAARSSAGGTA